jgi:mRNA interferase YafQ
LLHLKKPAASKRAPFRRLVEYTKPFLNDWERLSRSGRYDLGRLKAVMLMLIANDAPLGAEWQDHPLKGEWLGTRECHVGADFLLIYRVDDRMGRGSGIAFLRAGTHSELFK